MAHLKRYGPQLNDNIEKVEIFFKNGVPAPSEVSPVSYTHLTLPTTVIV